MTLYYYVWKSTCSSGVGFKCGHTESNNASAPSYPLAVKSAMAFCRISSNFDLGVVIGI